MKNGYIILIFLIKVTFIYSQEVPVLTEKQIIEKEIESEQIVPDSKFGGLAEVYAYSELLNDKISVGGYYFAITYRPLTKLSLGLGYDLSVFNNSLLLDYRQEITKMRTKPVLILGLGHTLKPRDVKVTSSFNISQNIKSQGDIVYKAGLGTRTYISKRFKMAINAGIFFKSEPSFDISESKSGAIIVESLRNKNYLCFFTGISF